MSDTEECKRAYVIDDEELLRNTVIRHLKRNGYRVEEFTTVDEAMRHMGWEKEGDTLTRNLPHVVITDYDTKSSMNGLDLLRALKDTGVGLVLQSGHKDINETTVKEAGGASAVFCTKFDAPGKGFENLAKQAMEQVALGKLGRAQREGGMPLC